MILGVFCVIIYMPLPSPEKNQKQNDFVSSCMSDETMRKEFPNSKQRAAVCYSQFSKKKTNQKQAGKIITTIILILFYSH